MTFYYLGYLAFITVVFVHLSCQGAGAKPLNTSKGTTLHKLRSNASLNVSCSPVSFTAFVPVISFPNVYPLNTFSQKV